MTNSKIMKITCIIAGIFMIINITLIYSFWKLICML